MIQKLQFVSRMLLLVCLPAFVVQPLLVLVVSSHQNSDVSQVQKASAASSAVKVHYIKESSAKRMEFHFAVLTPCFQKMILTFSTDRVLVFASDLVQHSPPGILILRI